VIHISLHGCYLAYILCTTRAEVCGDMCAPPTTTCPVVVVDPSVNSDKSSIVYELHVPRSIEYTPSKGLLERSSNLL
jgi:hypothetical protein